MSGLSFFKCMHLWFMSIWHVWITLFPQVPGGGRKNDFRNWDEVCCGKEFIPVFGFGHWERNDHKVHSAIWLLLDLLQRGKISELSILPSASLQGNYETVPFTRQEFSPLCDREPAEKKPGDNCYVRRRSIIQHHIRGPSFPKNCNYITYYTFTIFNSGYFSRYHLQSIKNILFWTQLGLATTKPFERTILSQLYLWLNTEHDEKGRKGLTG